MRTFRAYQLAYRPCAPGANQLREPAANRRAAVRCKGGSGSLKFPNQGGVTAPPHCPFSNLNCDGAKIWLPPSFGHCACSDFQPALPVVLGPPKGAPPLRVIRAVTVRYVRRWLAGWLLFRCLAPGFAGRALVLGNRPTCAGRFRVAGNRAGLLAGLSAEGGTGSGGGLKKSV